MTDAPVGVFDSGVGGLTVVQAIAARLPHEAIVYVGDTARVPYGTKSPEAVRRFSREVLDWLLGQGAKAVVVACNTSSAVALDALRAASPVPVLGVVEPGARAALAAAPDGPIGVIGTPGTVASDAYGRALHARAPAVRVHQQACPLFVPLAEEGWFDHPATGLVAREYLAPLRAQGVRAIVLGCTHYPLLRPLLQRLAGPDVPLVDGGAAVADDLAAVLAQADGLATRRGPGPQRFHVTDDPDRFVAVGRRFLGEALTGATRITLGAA